VNALPKSSPRSQCGLHILGATIPNLLREEGEAYRFEPGTTRAKNRRSKKCHFLQRFVDLTELTDFIGAADIYITPYLNETQITSGTLAYCFGAGKAVVSTPYWYAQELLAEGEVLVPFHDRTPSPGSDGLLKDDRRRNA